MMQALKADFPRYFGRAIEYFNIDCAVDPDVDTGDAVGARVLLGVSEANCFSFRRVRSRSAASREGETIGSRSGSRENSRVGDDITGSR